MVACDGLQKIICQHCVERWTSALDKLWNKGDITKICPEKLRDAEPAGVCFGAHDPMDVACKRCLIAKRCSLSTGNGQASIDQMEKITKNIPSWCPYSVEHIVLLEE
jgi:hypothetical protein